MKRLWTAGILGLLLVGGSVWGQLSQSGGAGTSVSAAQSGSWLMGITQGGNTATVSAAGALKIDGSAVTQPVSAASSSSAEYPRSPCTRAPRPICPAQGYVGASVMTIAARSR